MNEYSIHFAAVKIRYRGEAFVSFQDANKSKKVHADRLQYFDQTDIVLGNGNRKRSMNGSGRVGSGGEAGGGGG